MCKLNYETYFTNMQNYYDGDYLITILEAELGKNFNEIKNEIINSQLMLTEKEIIAFLQETFTNEKPEVKARLEKGNYPKKIEKIGTQTIYLKSKQELTDQISAKKYSFEPYTLEYFHNYIIIVKNKILLLLNIIEKIASKETTSIQNWLKEFDIQLNNDNNITKDDIIRIIIPTIYNIKLLRNIINKANNLSTYFNFKLSEYYLFRNNIHENEIYPQKTLLTKDMHNDTSYENIPLSKRQKQEVENQYKKNMKLIAKLIIK